MLEINPEMSVDLLPISERFLKHVEMKKELTNMSFMKNLENIEMFNSYLPLFLKSQEIVNTYAEDLLKNFISVGNQKFFNLKVLLDQYQPQEVVGLD